MNNHCKLVILLLLCFCYSAYSQEDTWKGKSTDLAKGKLLISEDGRHFKYKDGTPFFYLGDTAWELFHRLNLEEVELYLENRRAKGFTVIQAVILAELDGLNTPNRNGDIPFIENDFAQPNEAYFKWIDQVIRLAESKGLYIGLLPTWGDKVDKQWGIGPVIFNPQNAEWYGTWLGKRYKNFKNIIWIIGGDRLGGDLNYPIWDAMGKAIRKADKNHLITFHPMGERSSGEWFHNCEWLDFNMAQTSHCQKDYAIYERILIKDYNRFPVKPCLDGEPRYENHPICWQPDSLGWFDDTDIRKTLYWSLFSGACGYTYGCHDIWQMLTSNDTPQGLARGNWIESMDLPGAFDLIHARRLMEKYNWENRQPMPEIIVSDNHSPENKTVALGNDKFVFVYFPLGDPTTLDLSKYYHHKEYKLSWMNPRTGELTDAGITGAISQITPPTNGNGQDWVLIINI